MPPNAPIKEGLAELDRRNATGFRPPRRYTLGSSPPWPVPARVGALKGRHGEKATPPFGIHAATPAERVSMRTHFFVICTALCGLLWPNPAFAETCQDRAHRITKLAPNSDYQCFENGARLFILKWDGREPPQDFFLLAGEALGGFGDVPAPIIEEMSKSCHAVALKEGHHQMSGVQFTLACHVRGNSSSVAITVDAH